MSDPSLPPPALLAQQAAWLAAARSRALRRIAVARRKRVLDLGAGYGAVTQELVRRARGPVVALDRAPTALWGGDFGSAARVVGEAERLPFRDRSFDLVFSQFTLLWLPSARPVLREIHRLLAPEGVLLAIEPVYSGLIEAPTAIATRDLWLSALPRAGADPDAGLHLLPQLAELGFHIHVALLETLTRPSPARFAFLRQLPLTAEERRALDEAERAAQRITQPWGQVAHLPLFVITARREPHS